MSRGIIALPVVLIPAVLPIRAIFAGPWPPPVYERGRSLAVLPFRAPFLWRARAVELKAFWTGRDFIAFVVKATLLKVIVRGKFCVPAVRAW